MKNRGGRSDIYLVQNSTWPTTFHNFYRLYQIYHFVRCDDVVQISHFFRIIFTTKPSVGVVTLLLVFFLWLIASLWTSETVWSEIITSSHPYVLPRIILKAVKNRNFLSQKWKMHFNFLAQNWLDGVYYKVKNSHKRHLIIFCVNY